MCKVNLDATVNGEFLMLAHFFPLIIGQTPFQSLRYILEDISIGFSNAFSVLFLSQWTKIVYRVVLSTRVPSALRLYLPSIRDRLPNGQGHFCLLLPLVVLR
jgi:hypothetical protein